MKLKESDRNKILDIINVPFIAAWPSSTFLEVRYTVLNCPDFARALQVSNPIPLFAPVTIAILILNKRFYDTLEFGTEPSRICL